MRGVPLPQATRQLPLRVTVLPGQDLGRSAPGSSAQTPCPWAAWRRRCRKHLHRALRLPYLPGPLLMVQAWGHLNRRGLDPRELTLQGITGAKALLRFLPPTLEMPQSRWRIQGQLVSPGPQGPTEQAVHAVCTSRAREPRKWHAPWALRVRHLPRTWRAPWVLCVCRVPSVCAVCPGRGMRLGHCTCARDVARALCTAREPCVWVEGKVLKDVRSLSGIFPNC